MFISLEVLVCCMYTLPILLLVVGLILFACVTGVNNNHPMVSVTLLLITILLTIGFGIIIGLMVLDYDGYAKEEYYKVSCGGNILQVEMLNDGLFEIYSEISVNGNRMCTPRGGSVITLDIHRVTEVISMSGLRRDNDRYETFYRKEHVNKLSGCS